MMTKRRLPSIALLLVLVVLVVVFVLATSSPRAELFYTADQRKAFTVQSNMRLNQVSLFSNFYIPGATVDEPQIVSSFGATECRVRATLDARYEEVEGVTATVYDLDFEGTYRLRYGGPSPTATLEIVFPFPTGLGTLNRVYFLVDGEEPSGVQYSLDTITWWTELEAGEEREIVVRYRARGAGSFTYALDRNRRLENLDVAIVVQGLVGSEVPDDTLPTTAVGDVEGGEQFAWQYEALIADRNIQVELPTRPGFVQRVEELQQPLHTLALFSPLLVGGFVAALVGVHWLTGVRLSFLHYLLAGLGLFLFYPGLTFLSGVLELPWAAVTASIVVTGLLVAFLGIAAGWWRTWWSTLLLAIVFLGLFSLGSMSRWRGLLITAGGALLVGVFMVLVARWQAARSEPRPTNPIKVQESTGDGPEVEETAATEPEESASSARYCLHCGAELVEAFAFCPACGHDAKPFRRCPVCGAAHYVSPEAELHHCPACGERMGE
jgi:hypothetical protein